MTAIAQSTPTVMFRVLGNVDAISGDHPVDIGHARQRCVLAALLVDANRPVPVDQLLDRVWGDRLPQRGREVLYSYLSRLRTILAVDPGVAIRRGRGGYCLVVDEDQVDLHRFHRLAARARAADSASSAVRLFDEGLGLWRGTAFADLDTIWLATVRDMLEAERHDAELDRTDQALRTGRHAELVVELGQRAARHPLDERLAGQLMLTLHRTGCQADALRHYHRVRTALADELGADPCHPLQQLYQRILTADPSLAVSPETHSVPRQLPPAPTRFVGRDHELAALTAAMDGATDGRTVAISVVTGCGGIGKTSLALHWAYQHLDRFPDGQLFVDLLGFSPTGEPMPPTTALRGFLDTLGVDSRQVPADPHAQAALFRTLIADKRLLLVLDNAADAAQVTPLLPAGPGCTVLITSRRHLTGLTTRYGAQHLSVDVLADAAARHLLASRLGASRVGAEPDAVDELLARCAGLPLALSIVVGRAHPNPTLPLVDIAAELSDAATRMGALDDDDPTMSLPAVLATSLRALSAKQYNVLGLLAIAPGEDISLAGAASLAGLSDGDTASTLRALGEASLLDRDNAGRYRMHTLIRLHVRDRAVDDRPRSDRTAALRRVVDFYLHTAHTGHRHLAPASTTLGLAPPVRGSRPLPLTDSTALRWFDAEHACLLAAQRVAEAQQWHRVTWELAWTMDTFHSRRGRLADNLASWQLALAAATHLDDAAALTVAHRNLGYALARTRRGEDGLAHFRQALALAQDAQDVLQQAHTHRGIAWIRGTRGENHQALTHADQALRLFQKLDNPVWAASALNLVGWYSAQTGEFDRARDYCESALAIHREQGNKPYEADVLDSLGFIQHRAGRHADAVRQYRQALLLLEDLGNTYERANTLEATGRPYVALGRHDEARAVWRDALDLYREQGRTSDAERVGRQLGELAVPTSGSHPPRR